MWYDTLIMVIGGLGPFFYKYFKFDLSTTDLFWVNCLFGAATPGFGVSLVLLPTNTAYLSSYLLTNSLVGTTPSSLPIVRVTLHLHPAFEHELLLPSSLGSWFPTSIL